MLFRSENGAGRLACLLHVNRPCATWVGRIGTGLSCNRAAEGACSVVNGNAPPAPASAIEVSIAVPADDGECPRPRQCPDGEPNAAAGPAADLMVAPATWCSRIATAVGNNLAVDRQSPAHHQTYGTPAGRSETRVGRARTAGAAPIHRLRD